MKILIIFLICLLQINLLAQNNIEQKDKDSSKIQSYADVYYFVDKMPEFPGGEIALRRYIIENFRSPPNFGFFSGKGNAYIRFIVDEKGEILKPQIARGIDSLIDKEGLRVVESMPNWIPGQMNNKKVKVWCVIPVTFWE